MAQSEDSIGKLFGKKWVIKNYEIAEQYFPATDVGKNDYVSFYQDHSVKSIDHELTILSKWKYDQVQNVLTLYSDSEKAELTTKMKIYTLNENEFVWQTTNPEGIIMVIHMTNETVK